jgi:hypothetical protein
MNSSADSPVDAICAPADSCTPVTRAAAECPMAQLLDTLSGKWTFSILHRLIMSDSPLRFGELQRSVSGITQKELTRAVRRASSSRHCATARCGPAGPSPARRRP